MNRSKVSDEQLSDLGDFQGLIERATNPLAAAQNHNLGRNVRVLKLLAFLHRLKSEGVKLNGAIDCTKAIKQNFSSPKPMEAAHFLPGQLTIAGREVWLFAQKRRVAAEIEFLFAEVEHLPAPFNHADSEAEAKGQGYGLCAALSSAVTILLRYPFVGPGDPLKPAYEEWHRRALSALQRAQQNKGAKPGVPSFAGTPVSATSTEWNRSDATRILGYYLADQQNRTWDWVATKCGIRRQEVDQAFE